MKKHICYLIGTFIIAFNIASCSKEEPCDPMDKESPCYAGVGTGAKLLLTKHILNGEIIAQFEYNDKNKRIRNTLDSGSIEYTYNATGLLSATIYKDENGKITHREDYTYGTNDKPISMVISSPGKKNDVPIDVQYTYSKNKILESQIPRHEDGKISTNTFLFNDQGNLTDIITTITGVTSTSSWSEFDDKTSAAIVGDPYYWRNSKNNAQRFQVKSSVYNLDQKWVFTYNPEGYPIKALVYNNGSTNVAEEHTFTYKRTNEK